MKKYVQMWFTSLTVLLAVLLSPSTFASTRQAVQVQPDYDAIAEILSPLTGITTEKQLSPSEVLQNLHPDPDPDPIKELIALNYVIKKEQDEKKKKITFDIPEKYLAPKGIPYQSGIASWYGPRFYGKRTASGEIFKKNELTAAHRTLPMGTKLRVTNQTTGQSVVVRVNDRGPFTGNRVIDLSHAAASALGMIRSGTCKVKIEKL